MKYRKCEALSKIILENAKTRKSAGLAPKLETLQAQSAHSESILAKITAENKLAIAKQELKIL